MKTQKPRRLIVERDKDVLTITLRLRDEYEAMLMFDAITADSKKGLVAITLNTTATKEVSHELDQGAARSHPPEDQS